MTTTAVALTSTAWVDLGPTPCVVRTIDDRSPAVLVVADSAPSLTTQGLIVSSRDQNGVPIAGSGQHVFAKALNYNTTVIVLPYTGGGPAQASESHIGEVGGNVGVFKGQFGPASSTTYAAGQAMSAPIEVTNMARVANGTGLLTSATLELATANTNQVDLVLFSSQPTGTYTAGSTFTLNAADRAKVSKAIKLTDWTALGAADSLGESTPAPKFFGCADTTKTTSLWVVPIARGSITLASATDASLTIRASRN